MKMKLAAALAATMAVGATCAFAANPFVDVPTDSWAYKSVVELADSGIIQGVDGTHFEGGRNITRYEAAEIVAKAMAHMDKASVEQRALINKLADEYADELNNLGVRVSALENKVGNVKLTGDFRLRYINQDGDKNGAGKVKDDDSWSYRLRLRANAQVNDRATVTYGWSTDNQSFGNNDAASEDDQTYTDLANVSYNIGSNWNVLAGRYNYVMGNSYGYLYGDSFDGAQLKYATDSFAATAGYGKFKRGLIGGNDYADGTENKDAAKTAYGELEGFFGNGSAAGVYYNNIMVGDNASSIGDVDVWGVYGSVNIGSKWNALANYENYAADKEFSNGDDSADMIYGKLTYGKAAFAAPKSWDLWVEYLQADNLTDTFVGSTNTWRNDNLMNNVESWGAGVDYTFAKNAQFQLMQSFASSAKDGDNDPGEETRAQFVFVF
ncbi:S-layer homology domain-containing protein [uncultured Megasphaera sp.]|uniref:S-layer homology domain-containing protein n=1 Tax=uncultured Megasphaera sp. TaxID=165188 RepID=UPI00265A5DCE|nr:S-layer homology domain-containing protein [uncultured Megasphaera sp.]